MTDDTFGSHHALTVNGHQVFVRHHRGASAWVVLIHGFPTSSFDWLDQWPALSPTFSLLAPDLLGLGRSAKPRGHRYTVAEQADVIAAAVAWSGASTVALVAHDYGDTVAQELLARQLDGHCRSASPAACC